MEERWVIRPLHTLIYQAIKDIINRKKILGRESVVTYEEIVNAVKEISLNIGDDEIRSALLKLELWEYIDVVNNGATLEIRMRGEKSGS